MCKSTKRKDKLKKKKTQSYKSRTKESHGMARTMKRKKVGK